MEFIKWEISTNGRETDHILKLADQDPSKISQGIHLIWDKLFLDIIPNYSDQNWDSIVIEIEPEGGDFIIYAIAEKYLLKIGSPRERCIVVIPKFMFEYASIWEDFSEDDDEGQEEELSSILISKYIDFFRASLIKYKTDNHLIKILNLIYFDAIEASSYKKEVI